MGGFYPEARCKTRLAEASELSARCSECSCRASRGRQRAPAAAEPASDALLVQDADKHDTCDAGSRRETPDRSVAQ